MRIKPRPIEIDPQNPFGEDCLGRREIADALTSLCGNLDGTAVLAIESPWGGGKTTFLQMWMQHLQNEGHQTVVFNAWETDFSGNALVSLLSELEDGIRGLKGDESTTQKLMSRLKKAGSRLARRAIPIGVRLASAGLVDVADFTSDTVESAVGQVAEKITDDLVSEYSSTKRSLKDFRETLAELVSTIREDSDLPLVICIDELDRCRPTYAVEMLETLKHLFEVDGVVFVLGIDREQLGHSIRSLYGSGMDANGYLQRFIDIQYRLRDCDTEEFVKSQFQRMGIAAILIKRPINYFDIRGLNDFPRFIASVFSLFGFSLRVQEQVLSQLNLMIRCTEPDHPFFPSLSVFLLCLKESNAEHFRSYSIGETRPAEVVQFVSSLNRGAEFLNGRDGIGVESWLRIGAAEIRDDEPFDEYLPVIEAGEPQATGYSRAKELVELGKHHQYKIQFRFFEHLIQQVELVQQFTDSSST